MSYQVGDSVHYVLPDNSPNKGRCRAATIVGTHYVTRKGDPKKNEDARKDYVEKEQAKLYVLPQPSHDAIETPFFVDADESTWGPVTWHHKDACPHANPSPAPESPTQTGGEG